MENADPTRALNANDSPVQPNPPAESPLPDPAAGVAAPSAVSPEPTQAMTPPVAPARSSDVLLTDAARRRQLETDLMRMGMSPAEIQRLIAADANSTEPTQAMASPAPPNSAAVPFPSPPTPKQPARPTSAGLQSFAADLMASKAAAQVEAIEKAAVNLPEFRESSVQEIRQAEALLREASVLRRREKFTEAEAKCREALAFVPKDAAALELLGDLLQGVARVDESLAAYKRATEADPKRSSAERKYGDLLMRQQKWGGADPEAVPRNPFVAVLLSALLPGAGQFYNGDVGKGFFFLLADLVFVYLLGWSPYGFAGEHSHKGINMNLITLLSVAGILYIAGLIDANVTAKQGGSRRPRGDGWSV